MEEYLKNIWAGLEEKVGKTRLLLTEQSQVLDALSRVIDEMDGRGDEKGAELGKIKRQMLLKEMLAEKNALKTNLSGLDKTYKMVLKYTTSLKRNSPESGMDNNIEDLNDCPESLAVCLKNFKSSFIAFEKCYEDLCLILNTFNVGIESAFEVEDLLLQVINN
jgi:hypothetical protein